MNVLVMILMLVRLGACQDQQAPIEQPGGTRVHVLTCSYVEPRDDLDAPQPPRVEKPT